MPSKYNFDSRLTKTAALNKQCLIFYLAQRAGATATIYHFNLML